LHFLPKSHPDTAPEVFMKLVHFIVTLTLALTAATQAVAAGGKSAKGTTNNGPKGARAKTITGEATIRSKDQSKIDFEAADIGGERKTPLGTLINQNKADKNYDFVKIRLRWHPEMVQSASALDSGK
jgi:hypothetical protein